ncbi:MAG: T9SS type A sorting domain-containing protein [Sphingobacteriales bacterium]|nr:T9SS type A sorting domain-containing protein [Sphingobacteriales bacterium]
MDDILQINSDATATLPEGDYLVQVLNIRNDFLTWLPSAPTTYVNLISSLFESCYSLTSQALSFSMVDCCEATTGIVTYPSGDDLNVCENTTATDISIQGAQTASNYQTLLVIVNSAGNAVASTPQTAINFTSLGLPLGSYTVYVINFELQHLDAITTFIASAQPWADFSLLTGGDACIAVDSGSATFTVIAAGTGNCLLPLAIDNLVETVSDDLLTYTVCFTILGGSGNYIVDGQAIVGNTYCSQPIACGTPYSFTTEDDMASSPVLVQGNAPCLRVCSNDAGIMPNFGGNVLLCADETTDYESVGYVLGEGDVLVYILHDEAGTELGNVFAVNTQTGAFSAASAGVAYNTVYYVSAVVGLADANGGIIWADECTKVAEGVPVVFLSPIVIETDGVCNNSTGEYTLTVFVSGGVPSFIPTESYTLSGAFNGTVQAGQNLSNTFASGTTNYTIIANDGTCSAALSNTFECVKGTPIEWLSFEGEVLPQGNRLMWKTASENNSDMFVVERSKNGQQFEYVGKVKAAGTSNGVRNYSFLDKTAPIGVSYYRIVERDLDGSTNPSNVIILVRHQARFAFDSLSPMPATTYLDVAYTGVRNGTVQVAVYNAIGSLVEKRHAEMQSGTNILTFSLSNYVPGVYFIRLSDGIQIISERFVVNR